MNRRDFLKRLGGAVLAGLPSGARTQAGLNQALTDTLPVPAGLPGDSRPIRLFLCGDVMTGRGIDQVLPHPGRPDLYEPYIRNALGYVELAEGTNGPIEKPVDYAYIWGDALEELRRMSPDVSLINLETAVTKTDTYWQGKGIHYRMHPKNVPCITAAGIDCCVLANNHVLDWGYAGLRETLETLHRAGVLTVGAGVDQAQAQAPALFPIPDKGRVVVFGFAHGSSGVPKRWAALRDRPGVSLLPDLSDRSVERIAGLTDKIKAPNDILVASIHWGGNWGYQIPPAQKHFAHRLIDEAGIHIVHGHSSHHFKGIEVYRNKPIIYGCGDFLNDYEGIGGHGRFRGDLALMYFPVMDPATGELLNLELTPMQTSRFQSKRVSPRDARWIHEVLNRESRGFGVSFDLDRENRISASW